MRADPVTQLLLRLRNKWRDYCFTILSLSNEGSGYARIYGVQCTSPAVVFCRNGERRTEQHVSRTESQRGRKAWCESVHWSPGQWISGASPLNFRKLIYLPANYQVINLVRRWFSFLEGEIRRLALIFLILSLEELSINQVINQDLKRFRPCLPFACCNTLRRGTHCCSLISYPIT